jgi:hypothetical protein
VEEITPAACQRGDEKIALAVQVGIDVMRDLQRVVIHADTTVEARGAKLDFAPLGAVL